MSYYVSINNKKRRKNGRVDFNAALKLEWNCGNIWKFISPCGAEYIVNTNHFSPHLRGAIAFGGETPLEAAQKAAVYNNTKLNEVRAVDLKYKKWLRETKLKIEKEYAQASKKNSEVIFLGRGC